MTTIHTKKNKVKVNGKYLRLFGIIAILGTIVFVGLSRIGQPATADVNLDANVVEDVNITGEWLGIVTEDYNNNIRYEYRLQLVQSGDDVRGTMYVVSTNAPVEIAAVSTIVGEIDGDALTYREISIDELYNISSDHWCMISADLNFEAVDGMDTLSGGWNGIETAGVSGCLPTEGRITLMRQP